MPNRLESSTFPGVRESLAHACWGLWHPLAKPRLRPTSTQAQKPNSLSSFSTLRRRTKPRWQPPQRPRAPFTPLLAFVSRNLLRTSAKSALLFLRSPHPEGQRQRAGTPPFFRIPSPDQPRLCPPSLFGSRSRKEPKRRRKKPKLSSVSEAFPKRWRKEPKFTGWGGVSAVSGESRSLASGLILGSESQRWKPSESAEVRDV